jgi:hypothetical protein
MTKIIITITLEMKTVCSVEDYDPIGMCPCETCEAEQLRRQNV